MKRTTMNRLFSKRLGIIPPFIVKVEQRQVSIYAISLFLTLFFAWTMPIHARKHANIPIYEMTTFSANFPKTYVCYKGHLFKTEMISVSSPQDPTDTTHVSVRWFIKSLDKEKGQNIHAQVGIKLDHGFPFTDEWLIPIKNGKGKGKIIKKMEGHTSATLSEKELYVEAKAYVDFSKGGMCSVKFRVKKK